MTEKITEAKSSVPASDDIDPEIKKIFLFYPPNSFSTSLKSTRLHTSP